MDQLQTNEQKAQLLFLLSKDSTLDMFTKDMLRDFIVITEDEETITRLWKNFTELQDIKDKAIKNAVHNIEQIIKAEVQPHLSKLSHNERKKASHDAEQLLSSFSSKS